MSEEFQRGDEDNPALAGVRVLDLSRVVSGPFCTQMLGDLGADVIKVEPPAGDDTRGFGPPFVKGISTYYLSNNRGKRSLVLDLKHPDAREVVGELAVWADVVVANYRPGVSARLGVAFEQLKAFNPELIYANISGFGLRGDETYSRSPGYDLVLQGMGGMPSLTGPVDGEPFKNAGSIADMVTALYAFGAINAALLQRETTGRGQLLDLSMYDGQIATLMYHGSAWLNAGEATHRQGNAHQSLCPYETLRAADGYFNLACGNDGQFVRLCSVLGLEPLGEDDRFKTNADRVAHREPLMRLLGERFKEGEVTTWLRLLGDAGVPAGPIQSVSEAVSHPQVEARGMVCEQKHPTLGTVRTLGSGLGFPKPSYATLPPPELGEHSLEVLRGVLGYSESTIQELIQAGAVGAGE